MKIVVVGKGLIGSAAARHLARAGQDVTLIGPDEPTAPYAAHGGSFASHYDEGRITRKNDTAPFYARAAAASIARYGEIAEEGQTEFFTAQGALMVGDAAYMQKLADARRGLGAETIELSPADLGQRFEFFRFPGGIHGSYEPAAAGHISPRRLVLAQTRAARRHGARVVSDAVMGIETGRVTTGSGSYEADEIIVAAGGWTDTLLGRRQNTVYARTVALHEITPDVAARLSAMPSLVADCLGDIYVLPPIRYPDGALWLKLGGDPTDEVLAGAADINDWFRAGGSTATADHLTETLLTLMPKLEFGARRQMPCVTTWSDTGLPEIRRLAAGLTVATAGNGAAAKCSDELGRLAAELSLHTPENAL